MKNNLVTYRPLRGAVQTSMTLPIAFKPVYVDTDVRAGDTAQKLKYQGLFIDGGMLNNYPLHAFAHIESTGSPPPNAPSLSETPFPGLPGDYPIAGDPKLRKATATMEPQSGQYFISKLRSFTPHNLHNLS